MTRTWKASLDAIPLTGEPFMSNLLLLDDLDAQYVNGGWGSIYNFSSTSFKAVTTKVGQTNTANNLGLGVLFGAGIATSEQMNISEIATFVL